MLSLSQHKHCTQSWLQNTLMQKKQAKQEGFNRVCVYTKRRFPTGLWMWGTVRARLVYYMSKLWYFDSVEVDVEAISWDTVFQLFKESLREMETVAFNETSGLEHIWTTVCEPVGNAVFNGLSEVCFGYRNQWPVTPPPRWLRNAADGWGAAGGVPDGKYGPVAELHASGGPDPAQTVQGQGPHQHHPESGASNSQCNLGFIL